MNGQQDKEPIFLGIDGGGSGCRVRLSDRTGTILGEGTAGPANTLLGLPQVFDQITIATQVALSQAGLVPDVMGTLHAGAGLAGLSLARERAKLATFGHPFATFVAETDAHIACLGAHAGGNGGIVIAGTGSCGLALVDGREHTVSGWGFALSDQGSGAALGRAALRRALSEQDGIKPSSPLGRRILQCFDHSPEAMFLWAEGASPGDYARHAPLVFEQAQAQDDTAIALVRQTAIEVAELIEALAAKGAPEITLVGGLAGSIDPWLPDRVRPLLAPAKFDALHGALVLARSGNIT
ncbi:MAG: N-acetylglucosamine kinase [Rhodospirillaceae bacterium]|nr:N-acetylglucosamine kinase [Rhodospirillaceae bacterium]MBT4691442.1 N-acetylglucosamine kinase [Rhodospirillaceae bacterium]MBT5082945.1 N-acetylglucosamine kinase [Rhodospirillaceae bacterium]MBT5524389.1 N-acetylglucosamine kinase [Rhodospirillaceae bacterium]MBT5878815.1 N-acetylglucosamine kinase [Rhodospirillaceae bacterium]